MPDCARRVDHSRGLGAGPVGGVLLDAGGTQTAQAMPHHAAAPRDDFLGGQRIARTRLLKREPARIKSSNQLRFAADHPPQIGTGNRQINATAHGLIGYALRHNNHTIERLDPRHLNLERNLSDLTSVSCKLRQFTTYTTPLRGWRRFDRGDSDSGWDQTINRKSCRHGLRHRRPAPWYVRATGVRPDRYRAFPAPR